MPKRMAARKSLERLHDPIEPSAQVGNVFRWAGNIPGENRSINPRGEFVIGTNDGLRKFLVGLTNGYR